MEYRMITINEWVNSSASRETSEEIMREIYRMGLGDAGTCEEIWRAPTKTQINEIAELLDGTSREYFWGSQGRDWLTAEAAELTVIPICPVCGREGGELLDQRADQFFDDTRGMMCDVDEYRCGGCEFEFWDWSN